MSGSPFATGRTGRRSGQGSNALLVEQKLIQTQPQQIKAQQTQMKAQRVQIARLTIAVKAIQVSLKANGQAGSQVRTAKAHMPMVHQ